MLLLASLLAATANINVLVIWDVQSQQTDALVKAIAAGGAKVVLSDTDEVGYDGTNPPLRNVDVVVHLNGTTFDREMTHAGQRALEQFVRDGGGYIHHEWNAYELQNQRMLAMRPLILFDRTSGYSGPIEIRKKEGNLSGHPVVWEVPKVFTMSGSSNIGHIHKFDEDPAQVLAVDQNGNDAIAIREYGLGRVVGFHHGGNWYGNPRIFDSLEARRLIVDAVRWSFGCDPSFREGRRERMCQQIAQRRG